MPIQIPYLIDMYKETRYLPFVTLAVWYFGGDWDLAQRQWSAILAVEEALYRDELPSERIVSGTIGRLTAFFSAAYAAERPLQNTPSQHQSGT
jgi:hypothetical protein